MQWPHSLTGVALFSHISENANSFISYFRFVCQQKIAYSMSHSLQCSFFSYCAKKKLFLSFLDKRPISPKRKKSFLDVSKSYLSTRTGKQIDSLPSAHSSTMIRCLLQLFLFAPIVHAGHYKVMQPSFTAIFSAIRPIYSRVELSLGNLSIHTPTDQALM